MQNLELCQNHDYYKITTIPELQLLQNYNYSKITLIYKDLI